MSLAFLNIAVRRAPPWTLALLAASGATFAALAAAVMLGETRGIDLAVIRAFQSFASYPVDVVMNAHTLVGQLAVTLPVSVLIALIAQRRLGGYAWLGPIFILATGGIELLIKNSAAHPGPPREFIRAFGNPLGIPREMHPSYSFPSGHITRLSFLALIIVSLFPSRAAVVIAATFIGSSVFARVYIGDHWISDALAGLALGTGVGAAAIAWMRAMARR